MLSCASTDAQILQKPQLFSSGPESLWQSQPRGSYADFIPRQHYALSRVPLIPEHIVRRHNVHFEIDTRFRRAARLLQYLWLTDHGIPTGIHVQGTGEDAVTMDIGSCLSAEAAEACRNFLSPAIHGLVRHELIMREEGAMIDEDRLFRNALSSMPLVFNLFGPMAIDLRLATAVFRSLLPDFVHTVESIRFEHSPGRHHRSWSKQADKKPAISSASRVSAS